MATPIGFDPSVVNATSTGNYVLGQILEWNGKLYRFVLNANAAGDNAIADGDLLYWASATALTVCNALNGVGSALSGNPPAGFGIGAITKNQYGFMQVYGLHTNCKSTASTAGTLQKVSATAATATDQTAATITSVGTALNNTGAVTAGRCTIAIRCL